MADGALMINVLSKKSRRKTQSFDLDESTKISVTKLSMQLLNFRGRIFAQFFCLPVCAFFRYYPSAYFSKALMKKIGTCICL